MRTIIKGGLVAASALVGMAGVLNANSASTLAGPQLAGSQPPADSGGGDSTPTNPGAAPDSPRSAAPNSAPSGDAQSGSDGVVTGDVIQTRFGPMQVEATISAGTITDIAWLQMPGDGHSQRINASAAPALVEEALTAQSADVSTISGATYTSDGFRRSLQSILDQAGL